MSILASFPTPAYGGIVAGRYVVRHLTDNAFTPYVVHWQRNDNGAFFFGDYYESLEDALRGFMEKSSKALMRNSGRY